MPALPEPMLPDLAGPRTYLASGPFSDPGPQRELLERLVDRGGGDPRRLAEVVRSLMVHLYWRSAYGVALDRTRMTAEMNLRDVGSKLARIAELEASLGRSPRDLAPLPPERKLIGSCRDHSLLWAALLRAAGIPARLRCGFARYFEPGILEDHWVVERWERDRWVVGDAQLDALMVDRLRIGFDPMDLPDGEFVSGGQGWLACRGGDDAGRYGTQLFWGWDFVKGHLVRDVNALAGWELLPWETWGLALEPYGQLGEADLEALDAAARLTPMRAGCSRAEARALADRPGFRIPARVVSVPAGNPVEVEVGSLLRRGADDD